jgi:SAM-dependent methyltransferase
MGHHVVGVDLVKHEGLGERVDSFVEADLNAGLPTEAGSGFDVVVAGDVLEHVIDPDALMADLASRLADHGTILVSVPNFGHWYPRLRTASGTFDYDQRGPLDRGHVRFFTRRSFERLIANAGLRVIERRTVGSPLDVLERGRSSAVGRVARIASTLDRAAVRARPTLFGYQFLYKLERA